MQKSLQQLEEITTLVNVLVHDPSLTWEPFPGAADVPDSRAFMANKDGWEFIVISAPRQADGRIPVGGSAVHGKQGLCILLAPDVAWAAWERANAKNN